MHQDDMFCWFYNCAFTCLSNFTEAKDLTAYHDSTIHPHSRLTHCSTVHIYYLNLWNWVPVRLKSSVLSTISLAEPGILSLGAGSKWHHPLGPGPPQSLNTSPQNSWSKAETCPLSLFGWLNACPPPRPPSTPCWSAAYTPQWRECPV